LFGQRGRRNGTQSGYADISLRPGPEAVHCYRVQGLRIARAIMRSALGSSTKCSAWGFQVRLWPRRRQMFVIWQTVVERCATSGGAMVRARVLTQSRKSWWWPCTYS